MLVYQATKSEFINHVEHGAIVQQITSAFKQRLHTPSPGEVRAWQNSMQFMYMALHTPDIPEGCGVAIEFGVPYTARRIDFLLTGRNDTADAAVIIELKQWESLDAVPDQDGIVCTFVGGTHRHVSHPSYQAWSYAQMIENYNEGVREAQVMLRPCAYLHNYQVAADPELDPLFSPGYIRYIEQAPVFCANDLQRLRAFICSSISRGDDGRVLYQIESGRLRPSRSLQDSLSSMLEGNEEFVMIDDQKVVFETAMHLARKARREGDRHVMIVRGGPGTGKSVIAINLLVHLTSEDMVVQYVSKNSAPRNVYSKLLQGRNRSMAYIGNLFRGPDKFHEHNGTPLDAVVVDEAHRLKEKSGLFGNLGINQIKEIIAASRFAIFFIDETQRVTIKDVGTVSDIHAFAKLAGAHVTEAELFSQFRCNGSNNYLDWLDDVLGIRKAPEAVASLDYDFRVFDNPNALFATIVERNNAANKSRIVAGYCWEWPQNSRNAQDSHDIVIPGHDFAKSWNLNSTGTWAIDEHSIHQVGCVHTCQGLEFEYVGVIIGDDLRFENGAVISDHTKRARSDASLKGIKSLAQKDPERAMRIADELIRNTYRVLMTRGLKGCYVFCTDKALAKHLRSAIPHTSYATTPERPFMAIADSPEED